MLDSDVIRDRWAMSLKKDNTMQCHKTRKLVIYITKQDITKIMERSKRVLHNITKQENTRQLDNTKKQENA